MDYKKAIFVLFILLFSQSIFATEDINSYQNLELEITNKIEFALTTGDQYRVDSFRLDSYVYPQSFDGSQELKEFDTTKNDYLIVKEGGIERIVFSYDEDGLQNSNNIDNSFTIESTTHRPIITKKVSYPIRNLDTEFDIYLNHIDLIDTNDKIVAQASALAQGEDDTYIIASKVAKWIREDITYDLSTVTANPNQKSTEVFESKAGVCREITNLFISMMRSLGIPARVVTGYAYTTSEEVVNFVGSNWGGHAWAEVYIGDKWVPFDLTYNQYGYVDASHIILDKSNHIRTTSASINATGYDFTLIQGSLSVDTDFEILDKQDEFFPSGFELSIEGPQELGFGSYGYLQVSVENTENFYQILFLNVAKTKEIELFDTESKMLIFEPFEEKELYFRYKIPEDLQTGFIYTFPFTIYNNFLQETYNVSVKEDFSSISESALPEDELEEQKFSNLPVEFDCNFILDSPQNKILCSVKNTNNFEIPRFEVCLDDECNSFALKVNERSSFSFETDKERVNLAYSYNDESGSLPLILTKPTLKFSKKKFEKVLEFNYTINNFKEGVQIELTRNATQVKVLNEDKGSSKIDLVEGNNNFDLHLTYGDIILAQTSFDVYLEPEKNWFEKIIIWFRNLF